MIILLLDDYLVPAGTELKMEIAVIQRDPEHYENPEVFNPDNFLPEKMRARHPYAYLAFSAGSRNCIGKYNKLHTFLKDSSNIFIRSCNYHELYEYENYIVIL